MKIKHSVGNYSKKVKNKIAREAVKKFAAAIGDPHPLYIDEKAGKRSRYKENVAPPTFPVTFDYGKIPHLHLPDKGLIHGEQTFQYRRPLLVGEEIYCWMEVEKYIEKSEGNSFLFLTKYGEEVTGTPLFTAKQIIIFTEVVRKEMGT